MPTKPEQLWDAIGVIGSACGDASRIVPDVIAKLIQSKLVELEATGLPQLTVRGVRH